MPGLFVSLVVIHILVEIAVISRVILRPHREPASRIAWIVVIVMMPVVGILLYLLLGEVSIGYRHIERMRKVIADLPAMDVDSNGDDLRLVFDVPAQYQHLFDVGRSISDFSVIGGNKAHLLADSNATIDSMVADIDAAERHVHLTFYIWLADNNGCKIVDALRRAAARGITCRAMADGLGSRVMIKSKHWKSMGDAGVKLGVALPLGNLLLRPFRGRVDLRNHRKILVIDGHTTYCGSQNCADPEFRVKPKFAPWVDAMIRFQGPIAKQNQYIFASDWMTYVDENLDDLLREPMPTAQGGVPALVVATGPTVRFSAMPEMFESLMYAARQELVISSPYYVPNESLQNALCAAAYRGVDTAIIFPARNDSWIVAAASRSYYDDLLVAGVKIHEYVGGLLHTKSLTIDGEIALIGSANMDRRSFDLNYENNILYADRKLTAKLRQRQQEYLDSSNQVTSEEVAGWPMRRRLWNNTIATLGPVL